MPSLAREIRKSLERVVKDARRAAERGARKALKELAVQEHEPSPGLSAGQRVLRNRLRAHGRQLGDRRDDKRGTQAIDRLVSECAYEHWHRLLFARFLAECNLLIEPETGVAISLDECRELALERSIDWLHLASGFAVRMLPRIFRAGDPVLEIALPPEDRQELEQLLKSLPREVFAADDSLGWVYQFWQAERKDEVNDSGVKIGADELAAVTQLFTEDYMVLFLLHNTLGAWWTGKRRAVGKDSALPGYEWTYLRLNNDGTPAAGTFDGWPRTARELKVLDPCMGSGHFLVFALPILVAFRIEEEGLSREEAVQAVLRDNLFGLELDPRCTQIAAFNLALSAWRATGYRPLPVLNLACSGLGINTKEEDWLGLAGNDPRLRAAMQQLYQLFEQAPVLGSLIDPKRVGGDLFVAQFGEARPLLERALAAEHRDEGADELAVTARGLLEAAQILGKTFTLVATNVPYLGRPDQAQVLKDYCDRSHPDARSDLATCFLERCLSLCAPKASAAVVVTQSWLFQARYRQFRERLLQRYRWDFLAQLGPRAFEMITGERVNVCLLSVTHSVPEATASILGLDATGGETPQDKSIALIQNTAATVKQGDQLKNPDFRVSLTPLETTERLAAYASCVQGLATSDDPQFIYFFWELPVIARGWECLLGTVNGTIEYGGRERLIHWENGTGRYYRHAQALKAEGRLGGWKSGTEARGRTGILVSQMSAMPVTLYTGEFYDHSASVIIVKQSDHLPAVWALASAPQFTEEVRKLDKSLKPSNNVFVQVPFDLDHWQRVAAERYPYGLPKPHSEDPTQWLFNGHPTDSKHPLQVAVARLVGYVWPRQTGSTFPDCSALDPDGLERYNDDDGIVCLPSLKGEAPAEERLRGLLAEAFGTDWSALKQGKLLAAAGHPGMSVDGWLREAFFAEHSELFHQRPFVWHIWDGLKNGFSALVNYHRLAAPNGEGRRTLEKLIYSYLGDWIDRQRDEQKGDVEGADARVASAVHLKAELERILAGEPPYDIFARWKPLHEQPIGWEPDLNDGVRVNIRPFLAARPLSAKGKSASILRVRPNIRCEKDRGKEPARPRDGFPWFWSWDEKTDDFPGGGEFDGNRWNDLHYTRAFKQAARDRHASRQEAQTR